MLLSWTKSCFVTLFFFTIFGYCQFLFYLGFFFFTSEYYKYSYFAILNTFYYLKKDILSFLLAISLEKVFIVTIQISYASQVKSFSRLYLFSPSLLINTFAEDQVVKCEFCILTCGTAHQQPLTNSRCCSSHLACAPPQTLLQMQ